MIKAGGLTANNPVLCAYARAKENGYSDDQIYIISIGTGEYKKGLIESDLKTRSTLGWVKDIIEIESESARLADILMNKVLPQDHYHRLQPILSESTELDEFDNDILSNLANKAEAYILSTEGGKIIDLAVNMILKAKALENSEFFPKSNIAKMQSGTVSTPSSRVSQFSSDAEEELVNKKSVTPYDRKTRQI